MTIFDFHSDCEEISISQAVYYVYIFGSIVVFIFSAFVIVTFIKIKDCRKPPGDLFLMISISDLALSIHWFTTALASTHSFIGPGEDYNTSIWAFCQIQSFISVVFGQMQYFYNVSFCIYTILLIKNALRNKTIPSWKLHALGTIPSLLVWIICFLNMYTFELDVIP